MSKFKLSGRTIAANLLPTAPLAALGLSCEAICRRSEDSERLDDGALPAGVVPRAGA